MIKKMEPKEHQSMCTCKGQNFCKHFAFNTYSLFLNSCAPKGCTIFMCMRSRLKARNYVITTT